MARAYLVSLPGLTPYAEALELQRSIAGAVIDGSLQDTVLLLEHEPVVTLGRRTDETAELHLPDDVQVDIVETNRGGKSTYHGPGQLVCYPSHSRGREWLEQPSWRCGRHLTADTGSALPEPLGPWP